jgi:hypothetical protein
LAELTQSDANLLLDALLKLKLIQQSEVQRHRPTVELTERGQEVMTGKRTLPRALPIPLALQRRLEALNVPAPRATSTAGQEGVSQRKQVSAVPADVADEAGDPPAPLPDFHWTWRVLAAGCTLAECENIRHIDRETALEHLLEASAAGYPVDGSWALTEAEQDRLTQVVASIGTSDAKTLQRHLPHTITSAQIQVFLRCRAAEQAVDQR